MFVKIVLCSFNVLALCRVRLDEYFLSSRQILYYYESLFYTFDSITNMNCKSWDNKR